jgi:hypothetical protein
MRLALVCSVFSDRSGHGSLRQTDLDAVVSPRNDGKSVGTCARSSAGGRTGRCTKWVVARSMICFCNCENDTEL